MPDFPPTAFAGDAAGPASPGISPPADLGAQAIEGMLAGLRAWLYQPVRSAEQINVLRQQVHGQQQTLDRLAQLVQDQQAERDKERLAGAPGLRPDAIEVLLADFGAWLGEIDRSESAPPQADDEPEARFDLATFVEQFTALRHEVNLQTRAVRTQQEQNAEVLRQVAQACTIIDRERAELDEARRQKADEAQRGLLKTLVDVYDALALGTRELERLRQPIRAALEPLAAASGETTALVFWQRWLRGESRREDQLAQARQAAAQALSLLDAILTGYEMSLRRIDRALEQHELEPIACAGERFDPEQMEVVEAAADSGRPAGEVVDEVRRGYRWHGRVFRCAQVRVAK